MSSSESDVFLSPEEWQEEAEEIRMNAVGAALMINPERADAEDVAQQVLIASWIKSHTIQKGKLKAYTAVAALNSARMILRTRQRKPVEQISALKGAEVLNKNPFESPEGALERRDRQRRLRILLGELPHNQRQALVLHHYEGFNCKEIGNMVGAEKGAIRTRLYRGYLKLRQVMRREDF